MDRRRCASLRFVGRGRTPNLSVAIDALLHRLPRFGDTPPALCRSFSVSAVHHFTGRSPHPCARATGSAWSPFWRGGRLGAAPLVPARGGGKEQHSVGGSRHLEPPALACAGRGRAYGGAHRG